MPRRARPFHPATTPPGPAVVGVDEVGRGAWCGPVVCAAVWFDPARLDAGLLGALDDSKRLSAAERRRLDALLRGQARFALAAASAARVDAEGLTRATLGAMARAVVRLGIAAPVIVDGRDAPPGVDARTLIGGDGLCPQIAAASILAKVARDRAMARLGARRPGWGWERNVGYGAAAHRAALAAHGPTPHHRRSFRPVALAARLDPPAPFAR